MGLSNVSQIALKPDNYPHIRSGSEVFFSKKGRSKVEDFSRFFQLHDCIINQKVLIVFIPMASVSLLAINNFSI